jgi:hypothetical protein
MNAHGPMMRRGNLLLSDGRLKFDRSDTARNPTTKPDPALSHPSLAGESTIAGNDPLEPAATGLTGLDSPRPIELSLRGRAAFLNELVHLIGLDSASRLVAAFSGMRLYVPHSPVPDDTLSETIGHQAALALARIYGGDRIDVPNPTPRRTRIIELRADGVSIDLIARSLHCTRRRVFQVLAEARRDRDQRPREVRKLR